MAPQREHFDAHDLRREFAETKTNSHGASERASTRTISAEGSSARRREAQAKLPRMPACCQWEVFAMLGDTASEVNTQLRFVLSGDELGATDQEKRLWVMQPAAVWQACQALQTQIAARRTQMEEGPAKKTQRTRTAPSSDHGSCDCAQIGKEPHVLLRG